MAWSGVRAEMMNRGLKQRICFFIFLKTAAALAGVQVNLLFQVKKLHFDQGYPWENR